MHDDHHDCDITPLTDADLAEMQDFLDRHCLPQNSVSLPVLDGLFAAFQTVPMNVYSAHWDQPVYGMTSEDAMTRFFTSPEEAERVDDLLWGRFHDVNLAFVENRVEETFFGSRENDVEGWCVGYLRGVLLHEREWEPLLNPAWEISLEPNIADAVEVLSEYARTHAESVPTRETFRNNPLYQQLLAVLPGAAPHLYAYWRAYEHAQMPKIRAAEQVLPLRVAPKPGCNERCPCGSGKKYKKCCGV